MRAARRARRSICEIRVEEAEGESLQVVHHQVHAEKGDVVERSIQRSA